MRWRPATMSSASWAKRVRSCTAAPIRGANSAQSSGRQTYQHLRVFDDVVDLVMNNYVGEVQVDKVMDGAMRGLADGLDPDSAFLNPGQVKAVEAGEAAPDGDVGIELTRRAVEEPALIDRGQGHPVACHFAETLVTIAPL